ncbi:two-component system sensor histidine kinase DesK [Tamaricihabitans halophyticus]|uniref:Two-component system sensor histidine kinase DesK n=1 Tax=Tamaricihabitans halophyticus TaxID=1262583 RepID=A0A4R2R3Q9_9PSEU|nr:histidine kinase [Tamaricihabitans halophyticus]TCP54015.1 two-component system sensor histidine kinase DesK [Tamaricihabitans halophyticus]
MTEWDPEVSPRIRRMRRYTWWSLVGMTLICALVPIYEVLRSPPELTTIVPLTIAAVVVSVLRIWLVTEVMRGESARDVANWPGLAALGFAIASWAYAAVYSTNPISWALLPALIGAPIVLRWPTAQRWRRAVPIGLIIGLVGAGGLALRDDYRSILDSVLVNAGFAMVLWAIIVLLDALQLWFWEVIVQVDRARTAQRELAVVNERLRFAADLHDVQGHYLQAIVLKGELAERLIGTDDAAARQQATELTDLARKALTDTRDVVHGYRATDLRNEIANAAELLRAAGIATEVHGDPTDIPPPVQHLFGALVKEGTTNILRHSDARNCKLTMDVQNGQTEVRLVNDGATVSDYVPGSGITGLRDRFATLGGQVTAARTPEGRFELAGQTPRHLERAT